MCVCVCGLSLKMYIQDVHNMAGVKIKNKGRKTSCIASH